MINPSELLFVRVEASEPLRNALEKLLHLPGVAVLTRDELCGLCAPYSDCDGAIARGSQQTPPLVLLIRFGESQPASSQGFYPGVIDLFLYPGDNQILSTVEFAALNKESDTVYTAFNGHQRFASGSLHEVALAVKSRSHGHFSVPVLIFDDKTGRSIDFDLRGTDQEIVSRLSPPVGAANLLKVTTDRPPNEPRGRGRPKLGVVAREVTLLPRHWDWLNAQPGGASVSLRRLVEDARRANRGSDENRQRLEAAYHFMSAMAGDLPGFEEATRALFANDRDRFFAQVGAWPSDVRDHIITLAFADKSGREYNSIYADEPVRPAPPSSARTSLPIDPVIPLEKRDIAYRAIRAAFGESKIEAAVPLAGGAAGPAAIFRIVVNGSYFLLRIEGQRNRFRDPVRQYACLKIAGEAGVSPRLIYADANDGVAITEFIQATSGSSAKSRTVRLMAIVDAVKTLHAAPLFPGFMHYLDCVDTLIGQVQACGILSTEAAREPLRHYEKLASIYPRHDLDLVSSHNDLNPSNILFADKRLWLVDWESAFATDRYVDVAAVANFFAADEHDEELILRAYFGDGLSDYHRARFFLMQQVNRMFYASVLLNSVAAVESGIRLTEACLHTPMFSEVRGEMSSLATHAGRKRFACVFLHEVLVNVQSARFESSIEIMNMSMLERER